MLTWIGYACGLCAAFAVCYTVAATVLLPRFFARPRAAPTQYPAVTVLKPLHGHEYALLENLEGFCAQDYPAPVQFLFGVHDRNDPALKTVEALRALHPQADIAVVIDSRLYGPNRKISNTVNMLPHARHDVLVFADSDVGVSAHYLRDVVGELQRPGVGLVTCAYRGQPDPGFWPRLSANATNYQFLPGVVVGLALGLAKPCFGQTIAMRRDTLEAIGGYLPFAHHLAEDHAIGEAVRATGQTVAIPPVAVTHACAETTFGQLVSHELRWSRTIRAVDPAGHLGSALTHPLPFALVALALAGGAAWSWALVAAALVVRLALKLQADRTLRQPCRDLWLLPLWDILSFAIFAASFGSTRVIWRGVSFEVDGKGLLYPVQDK
ncbi:bacteriohopanetetrol glucosamine biosynthesis glycosyltransferase HpnI [Paraburkholderia kururiensis]|uniref:Bacteriohopanetetrol glucosamine biosynthesis glycosyltransferase HpnI n=2 Tax=Paraburkholderia kururiensis TaxID=984307 RepID=A0ABZ0WTZ0_9BURK|nr:bacteriohopanetetrol glucosamine biosynthesis glycosyltransferase HpnI [Paraburkholderia kururiensis]WQD80880.1 bacteriohopanetetrol glucosamine biosynthesis glycosyltransferase HpnI [Paraburkholderia kururiensis]